MLKISDFGLSRSATDFFEIDLEGDKYYMAAEVLEGEVTTSADVFSLGLLALELFSNIELPAFGDGWHELRDGNVDLSTLVPSEYEDFIGLLLHPNSSARLRG